MEKYKPNNENINTKSKRKNLVSMEQLAALDPESNTRNGDMGSVLYLLMLKNKTGNYTKTSLIAELIEAGNDGEFSERLLRARKTVDNFIDKGYIKLGKDGKLLNNMEIE